MSGPGPVSGPAAGQMAQMPGPMQGQMGMNPMGISRLPMGPDQVGTDGSAKGSLGLPPLPVSQLVPWPKKKKKKERMKVIGKKLCFSLLCLTP